MELTLDQALQKGIEAHKAGQVQEADRYYTAILKANPKHLDANHNMGVLAVGVGKVEAALPFFKTALETNPDVAQFWLSYIDALIKLDRIAGAKAVLEQAKGKVAKSDSFDQIEIRLANVALLEDKQTDAAILKQAVDLRESGKYHEAIDYLKNIISNFPTDPDIPALLSHCYILNDNLEQAKIYLDVAKNINPNIAAVGWNETRLLLKQNKLDEALVVAKKANKLFPDDVEGIVVLGSCLRATDSFDESLKYLNKAIELNPNYAEALINRGLLRLAQKDKANALSDLEKAHQLKPHIKQIWDFIIALYNEEARYEEAINCLVNMIGIDPDHQNSLALLALCNQKADDIGLAIMGFQGVLEVLPENVPMLFNLGIAMSVQGDHESAIEQFNKAVSIKPDFAEAYNSLGAALQEQGKLDEAIEAYTKAASIKPDFAEAYNNMGVALSKQGKLAKAIEAFNKAIKIKPDYADAYCNMGITLHDQGKIDDALVAYNKALSIRPDFAEAIVNVSSLRTQISETTLINEEFEKRLENHNHELLATPKFHIYQAIRAFLLSNQELVRKHLDSYNNCPPSSIAAMSSKDQVFCSAYNIFLQKLIKTPFENKPTSVDHQTLFHLGESHCLSYAHRLIKIHGINSTVVPRIKFGAKAYHFSTEKENSHKTITKANFHSIPDSSKVFLSFGEIDCRPNEGFVSAASKLNRPIENIISDTVEGYVSWFVKQNESKNHSLFFFNVHAPIYDEKYSPGVNNKVKSTIKLFNNMLNKAVLDYNLNIIDVYKFTVGHDEFSNGSFHIDQRHLSSAAIPEIEKQIGTFL